MAGRGASGALCTRRIVECDLLCPTIEVAGPGGIDEVAEPPTTVRPNRQIRSKALGELLARLSRPERDISAKLSLEVLLELADGGRAEDLTVQPDADIVQFLERQKRADVPEPTRPWRLRVREVGEASGNVAAVGDVGSRPGAVTGHLPSEKKGAQPVAAPLGGLCPLY